MPVWGRPIGQLPFVDGVVRAVYEELDSGQFVIGGDGKRVHGVWVLPPDEPQEVVTDASRRSPLVRRQEAKGVGQSLSGPTPKRRASAAANHAEVQEAV
jgi:hypothetical protein